MSQQRSGDRAFRETITAADGTTHQAACSEAHALALLARAVRLGCQIEGTAQGRVIITRDLPGPVPRKRSVILEPLTHSAHAALARRGVPCGARDGQWACGRIPDHQRDHVAFGAYSLPAHTWARS